MGRAFEYRRAAKEKRWGNMSRIFPKLGRQITIAAKEGGPDPTMNPKLRLAINMAKANNMPKDNVEAAIKRAEGKDSDDLVMVNYEGKGAHGIQVVLECATDNPTRTVANVKSYFNKAGGTLVPTGSLEFLFDRKTVVEFQRPAGLDLEEFQLEMIDFGLDELEEDGDTLYAYGDYSQFGTLVKAFEEKGIEVASAKLERIPNAPQEFSEDQMADIQKMLDKMEDDEDIQEIYTNMA
ncbi:MAG: YebC/PmpR family DNA-binding transcriptional regulator [Saprospiraceae bacterium]|jgi:YebC/PmpR family DNA-binding regulatory protein|nr:YebC/PmpR family DNA-binding transcriptional regulator [Saprospiraceae bacterium]MBP7643385.1 YebC/PmpR family DNA-binding transcriptional regulator [Saprospiraceae bacterium]HMS67760.1 YebC/PmpR family DNA-binding transcriptional regulator [Saprospiraceae bacterium]